jgi:uncharacterized iron-regulated protein
MHKSFIMSVAGLLLAAIAATTPVCFSQQTERCEMWIYLYSGEPCRYEDVLSDLLEARVIYLGERHTLERHHDLQQKIVSDLAAAGLKIAVGLEMLPVDLQPVLDRYNSGEIDFDQLAAEVGWKELWDNYEQYRGAIEAAHGAGAPILALNARRDLARQIGLKGVAGLDPEWAEKVPEGADFDQPDYERELTRDMMVMAHATGESDMMHRMFQAQVVKDEVMADAVVRFLRSPEGEDRSVVVLCGAGHVSYGYGIPYRVKARIPGLVDRIVVFSESGDLVLSEREKAMSREIEVTHAQLRENRVPLADYVHARALAPEAAGD